jgi:hypothetical protein
VCFVDSTADVTLYQANFEAICQAISEAIVGKQSTLTLGTPASSTPIVGNSVISAEAMAEFLSSKNNAPKISCTALELARLFIDEGWDENVRGDIAFCQSIHETGWFKFGGDVLAEQNNFCGLGATNATPKGKGAWFDTPRMGVRAQVQHLKAYASKEPLAHATIDPRFHLVTRGVAPNWEDLNGRWAVPGTTYAQQILKVYDDLCAFVSAQTAPPPSAHWAEEHYEYLTLIGMKINEKRFSAKLTRGEAFALLAEYDKSRSEGSSKKPRKKARFRPRPITLDGIEEGEDIASKNLASELAKTAAAKSAALKKGAAKKKKK